MTEIGTRKTLSGAAAWLRAGVRLALLSAVCAAVTSAPAATLEFTWDGSSSGLFSTNANWVGNTAPPTSASSSDDDRIIFGSITGQTTVVLNQGAGTPKTQVIGEFRIDSGANAYTFNANTSGSNSERYEIRGLTTSGTLYGLRNLGTNTQTFNTIVTLSAPNGSSITSTNSTGILTFNADVFLQGSQNWVNNGTINYNSDFNFNSNGEFATFSGTGDFNFAKITDTTGSGVQLTFSTTGTTTINGLVTNINGITISAGTVMLGTANLADYINDTNTTTKRTHMTLSGGTFNTNGKDATFYGTLTLTADSTIDLGSGDSVLRYANSSGQAWTSGEIVSILNWSGVKTGGGTDQVYFGTSAAGLTSAQLSQIRFVNPLGFSPGTYGAIILATGEVVPYMPEGAPVMVALLLLTGSVLRRRRHAIPLAGQ